MRDLEQNLVQTTICFTSSAVQTKNNFPWKVRVGRENAFEHYWFIAIA